MTQPSLVSAASLSAYDDIEVVKAAIRSALAPFGGMESIIKPGGRVLLKPNFVLALDPERGGVTHPVFIAAVAEVTREAGAGEIVVGDSPALGSAGGVARRMNLRPLLEKSGARLVEFKGVRRLNRKDNEREVFIAETMAEEAFGADTLINLPKAKAHCQMTTTGAVKNLFGCVKGRKKALLHCLVGNDKERFARMLLRNAWDLKAAIHLMDGGIAMQGEGPTRGEPRPWGWTLAAKDPVALDVVMSTAMGYAESEVPQWRAARELGLGAVDAEAIDLLGASAEDLKIEDWLRAIPMEISFNPLRLARGYVKQFLASRRRYEGSVN